MIRMFSPTPGVDNHEQTASRAQTERDQSLFIGIGFVRDRDRVRIVKDRNRFGHPDTVQAKVESCFARFIPFEAHLLSVRTLCTDVNAAWRFVRFRLFRAFVGRMAQVSGAKS